MIIQGQHRKRETFDIKCFPISCLSSSKSVISRLAVFLFAIRPINNSVLHFPFPCNDFRNGCDDRQYIHCVNTDKIMKTQQETLHYEAQHAHCSRQQKLNIHTYIHKEYLYRAYYPTVRVSMHCDDKRPQTLGKMGTPRASLCRCVHWTFPACYASSSSSCSNNNNNNNNKSSATA